MIIYEYSEPWQYTEHYNKTLNKENFLKNLSLFISHDFGPRTSQMMDYQQAAMQWLKDFVEKGCAEQADVF
jgi:hypothetical protein